MTQKPDIQILSRHFLPSSDPQWSHGPMAPDVVLHALDAAATQVCGGDLLFADRELHAVALARDGSNGLPGMPRGSPGKPREAERVNGCGYVVCSGKWTIDRYL